MFAEYVQAALRRAKYEVLEDDTYMATVEGLQESLLLATQSKNAEMISSALSKAGLHWVYALDTPFQILTATQ